jgi:helicase required for RNAi-mediated heterochromatin assembly 1
MNTHISEKFTRGRKSQPRANPSSSPSTAPQPVNTNIRNYIFDETEPPTASKPWLLKSEIPTSEEILNYEDEDVQLLPNKLDRPWKTAKKYLETHYELMREDAIAPLRDAVHQFKLTPDMPDDHQLCVYLKVRRSPTAM